MKLVFKPLTPETWKAFEDLFGEKGACGGCWCMNWRLQKSEFDKQKGNGNKQAIRKLAKEKISPGVLAFEKGRAIGWCAVAPREKYIRLAGSKILAPVDSLPAWGISCLYIAKEYRNKGVSSRLIDVAVKYAFKNGAKIVEAYPTDAESKRSPDPFVWTGITSTYLKNGFVEVARRSEKRPVLRFTKR